MDYDLNIIFLPPPPSPFLRFIYLWFPSTDSLAPKGMVGSLLKFRPHCLEDSSLSPLGSEGGKASSK